MTPPSCLRSLRLRHNLSQRELADLIGLNQSNASRLENGETAPDIELAFALQIVFGVTPSDIFPRLYYAKQDATLRRAAALESKLIAAGISLRDERRRLLLGMVERAKTKWRGI
jgi:transcriptional regulator with XRE-family HTH domain